MFWSSQLMGCHCSGQHLFGCLSRLPFVEPCYSPVYRATLFVLHTYMKESPQCLVLMVYHECSGFMFKWKRFEYAMKAREINKFCGIIVFQTASSLQLLWAYPSTAEDEVRVGNEGENVIPARAWPSLGSGGRSSEYSQNCGELQGGPLCPSARSGSYTLLKVRVPSLFCDHLVLLASTALSAGRTLPSSFQSTATLVMICPQYWSPRRWMPVGVIKVTSVVHQYFPWKQHNCTYTMNK